MAPLVYRVAGATNQGPWPDLVHVSQGYAAGGGVGGRSPWTPAVVVRSMYRYGPEVSLSDVVNVHTNRSRRTYLQQSSSPQSTGKSRIK